MNHIQITESTTIQRQSIPSTQLKRKPSHTSENLPNSNSTQGNPPRHTDTHPSSPRVRLRRLSGSRLRPRSRVTLRRTPRLRARSNCRRHRSGSRAGRRRRAAALGNGVLVRGDDEIDDLVAVLVKVLTVDVFVLAAVAVDVALVTVGDDERAYGVAVGDVFAGKDLCAVSMVSRGTL